jgi:hypothetical protein
MSRGLGQSQITIKIYELMMRFLTIKLMLIGSVYLIAQNLTFAASLPSELVGTWGPAKENWKEYGRSYDGRPVRCDANPSTGNLSAIFYGFFPDGELAAGNLMGAQCRLKRIDATSSGYSGVMDCRVEGSIKETRAFIYKRSNPPQLNSDGETLYKCKSTL